MAMDGDTLGDLIKTNVESISLSQPMTASEKTALFRAIGNAIVDHITGQAVVAMADGGADTNGDTLVTNEGSVS